MPNTWRATSQRPETTLLPLPEPIPTPGGEVEVGQIWASNDSRDRRNGWRQERIVVAVRRDRFAPGPMSAVLYTLPGKRHQSTSTNGITGSRIDRHRYVRQASEAELAERGLGDA